MKRTFLVLCAAFAIGSVGFVGAEQYGGGQSTSSKSKSSKSSSEVTLTGCLEQGSSPNLFVLRNATESEGGSMGSSSSQMGESSQGTSGSSNSGTSAQGTTGSQGEQQSAMDFQLVGKSKELKKYVGQRIEVRGKVEPMRENQSGMSNQGATSGGSTSGQMGGTTGTSGTEGGTQSGGSQSGGSMSGGSMSGQSSTAGAVTHRVKVNSVKQLSSSCQ